MQLFSPKHSFILRFLALPCLLCTLFLSAFAQDAPLDPRVAVLQGKLQKHLERIAEEFDGVLGVAVKDLTTGQKFLVNEDIIFPQASSIKIPILIELYRQAQAGKMNLLDRVELRRRQATGGSGVLQHFGDGTSALALRDLAVLMIVLSDNTATNILIERVGMENVNSMLRTHGFEATRLQRIMMDAEAGRASRENVSTPREMARLLEQLHRGKLLDAVHTAQVVEILSYPKNSPLRAGIPGEIMVASKPGGIPGVRCDSGIVLLEGRPYVISVMTTFAADADDAGRAITEISRRVFRYFERLARSNNFGARQG